MDNKLTTKIACLQRLTDWGIDFILHEHIPTPTMAELKQIQFKDNTAYVKNLFYVDKKSNFYLVIANNDTQIGKLFWKNIGLSSGNMRLTKPEQIIEIVQSQVGHVNPFSLVNDDKDVVKKVIIDQELLKFNRIAFHPCENVATVEITMQDFQDKFLKIIKKEFEVLNLTDVAAQAELDKQQQQKQQEIPQQDIQQLAITIKKTDNFSKWYQQVITKAELIEYYDVSGCYILRPWAYNIWECIQKYFDELIKADGVDNSYFPMFLCEKQLNKEKEHVEGFKAEVAWVTRYGDSELNEPLAIRPTSETIMYPAFAKWIQSHRDLPLKLNQWTNIVRWEFKFPTPFIRTREFLWQEGHTAHAHKEEAVKQVYTILDFYESVYANLLAVPVIKGIKTESEKFAGGDFTSTVETIIPQNGRGLQAATSHHLGQNFSKMFDITFEDIKKQKQHAWQTSWGLTTRSIGAMVMFHGDDKGLVLPPRVAKYQVIIIPIVSKDVDEQALLDQAAVVKKILDKNGIRSHIDNRDNYSPGWKYNHWEQKGVPLRFEIGPGELKKGEVRVVQRFDNKKYQVTLENLNTIQGILDGLHTQMYEKATASMQSRIRKVEDWKTFMTELNKQNSLLTKWCQQEACEQSVKKKSGQESKEQDQIEDGQVQLTGAAKTLCMPLKQDEIVEGDKCFACGEQAKKWKNKEIPRQPLTSVRQTKIIDVWAHNFVAELKEISELLEEFNVVAMDTEFPGVKEYPVSGLEDKEYEYYQVYNNVKNFKLIQIGLNLANERGEVPSIKNTWQFHFKFSTNQGDKIIENVQAMLESAGIDFKELDNNGIDQDVFCDYITSSGLILNDDVKYIVFHGQFDFGYLLNLFHHSGIPEKSDEFLTLMKQYFPQVYDLKYAIRDNPKFKDIGLSKLAYKIDVHRIGPEHQAGSDALLTMQCYQQMKMLPEFEYEIGQMDKNMNVIYGIGKGYLNNTRRKPYGQSNNQTPDIQLQQNQQQQQQQYYDYQPYYDQQYDPFLYYNLQSYYPQQFQQIQEQDVQKRKGMQY